MAVDGKEKALETTLMQIRRRFGEGAIMKLGDSSSMNVEAIPTGADYRDLWPRILRKDDPLPAHHRRVPKDGGHCCFH